MTQRRIYQNDYPYFITFRIRDNFPLFEDKKMAELLADIMVKAGQLKGFYVLAYQIMPDHVHLLVQCNNTNRTLEKVRLVGDENNFYSSERTLSSLRSQLKQYNISDLRQSIKGNFSRKLHMGNIWQPRFYTCIINTHQYLRTVIEYIQYNPIKAKLPVKYHLLPYQYCNKLKTEDLF